jgi:hypothetical protein
MRPSLRSGLIGALTPAERRRILDAADTLPVLDGRSRDRHRYREKVRPQRKVLMIGAIEPFRNRRNEAT